jgi:chaperonin GroES
VLYFKYAGDNMETPDGTKFVVLREDDILCLATA